MQTVLECLLNVSRISFPGRPWWFSDWESALQCRAAISVPGWGIKIPPVTEQLSPSTAAAEPVHSGVTWAAQLESLRASPKGLVGGNEDPTSHKSAENRPST